MNGPEFATSGRGARIAAAVVVAMGLTVLLGWSLDVVVLRTFIPRVTDPMAPTTAVGFLLTGLALWLLSDDRTSGVRRAAGTALAVAGAALGLLAVVGMTSTWDVLLERLVAPGADPRTMPKLTAVNFILCGTALLLLRQRTPRSSVLAGVLAGGATSIAVYALIGAVYRIPILARPITVPAAIAFLALSSGIVAAAPKAPSRGPGRWLLRRLLPSVGALVLLIGLIRPLTEQLYGDQIARAITIVGGVGALAAIIWLTARALDRIEAQRREAQERFRALADTTPDGIISADAEGTITFFNPGAEAMFGYSATEIVGRPVKDLMPERLRDAHVAGIKRYIETREPRVVGKTVELVGLRRDGTEFPLELSLSTWTAGDDVFFTGIVRDITERVATQRAVEESQERVAAVLRSLGEGVVTTDPAGIVVSVNPAMEQLAAWTEAEAIGRPYHEVYPLLLGGEPLRAGDRFLAQAIASRTVVTSRGYDLDLLTRDGRHVPVAVTAAPVLDHRGRVVGGVDVLRDVSHEREVDRMKSSLISTVSHELRTPLTMIQGFSELLLSRDFDVARARSALEQIHLSAERLDRLIEDLLSVSRIESGRLDVRRTRVDLEPAVREAVTPFERDRRIDVDLDGVAQVFADRDMLIRVITNLLSNAVKYSADDRPVSIVARRNGGHAEVSVADRGIGMTEEEVAQLFDKFFRADRPEVRNARGTGLGLYITKSLVEVQGGRIAVDSKPGEGTTFSFTVPLVNEETKGDAR